MDTLELTLPYGMLARIDELRGIETRERYILRAIEEAVCGGIPFGVWLADQDPPAD